jgi:hypothetical protein
MTLTNHARDRAKLRFPEITGVKLLEEFESAKPPDRKQTKILSERMNKFHNNGGHVVISRSGIVFIVSQEGVVLTLFPMPTPDQITWKKTGRKHPQRKGSPAYERRRQNDKRWKKLIDASDD